MTLWFNAVEALVTEAARRCEAEVFTDLASQTVTLSASQDSMRAEVSFSVGNDTELAISIGKASHYDVYDKDPRILIAEARDVLAAVLDGLVRETVWVRDDEPVAAEAILLNSGRRIQWRKGFSKRGATVETLVYRPYSCA